MVMTPCETNGLNSKTSRTAHCPHATVTCRLTSVITCSVLKIITYVDGGNTVISTCVEWRVLIALRASVVIHPSAGMQLIDQSARGYYVFCQSADDGYTTAKAPRWRRNQL
jgi:hypothetical protein